MAGTDPTLFGKRKKKVPKCANPLFVEWLTEWRDEAQEKGWNSRFSYSKALSSLRKYPLSFATGKECKILEFVGDKVCKMLDKRLEEHIAEYGDINHSDADEDDVSHAPVKKVKRTVDVNLDTGETQDAGHGSTAPTKKRRTSVRDYIPAYRSAPYALVLTLHDNHQSPHSRGYMAKKELTVEAQRLADKSLTVPEPGTYYCGWSSMGALIKKGYVLKEGNPGKYSITESGIELARKVLAAGVDRAPGRSDASCSGVSTSPEPSPVKARPTSKAPTQNDRSKFDYSNNNTYPPSGTSQSNVTPAVSRGQPRPGLQFTYLDESGNEVGAKDMAEVIINEELGVGFLVKCKYTDLLMTPKRYQLDNARCRDGQYVFAYLHNEDADEYSNSPLEEGMTSSKTGVTSSKPALTASSSSELNSVFEPKKNLQSFSGVTCSSSTLPLQAASKKSSALPQKVGRYEPAKTNDILPVFQLPKPRTPTKDSQDSQSSCCSSATSTIESFTLYPGQYSIVLCVDNREHFGQPGSSKQNLLPELNRNGVNLDVRNLAVGDFLWIARENVRPRGGQLNLPESRELVLDWIVERKRMDDLCSSIKDGRFKEQKFRMRNSGLRRPTYLVEAYGSAKNLGLPEDSLNQAVINSQIVDGFHVKHTRDQKETVAYLTVMTRQLQHKFSNRTLVARSRAEIDQYKDDLSNANCPLNLLTFDEFNKLNVKTQAFSVRDMFAKQLMTLSGLSQDKTTAILKHYPVPMRLFSAYRACVGERDRENLLANIKYGQSNRNVGSAVSRLVYLLYNTAQLQ